MKKSLFLILILLVGLVENYGWLADAAGKDASGPVEVAVSVPKSPTCIPILRMMETGALGPNVKIDLKFYSTMDQLLAVATRNECPMLAMPVNSAVTLYNKGFDIKLLNISVWGGMYLSTTDPACRRWEDLKGKQLYVPAKGSVPDLLAQVFLKKHGLKPGEDVELVYSNHTEIAQLLAAGKVKQAIDAEPFVTANKENVSNYRVLSDFRAEWRKFQGRAAAMPNFGVVVNGKFFTRNKQLMKTFNKAYQEALNWTVANPREAGELVQKHLNANGKLIEKAMPNFNFVFKSAAASRKDLDKYCRVLMSAKPESIGGKLPDESFYADVK
jgi:NitT/TauT family transport system substrate-binding protein